MKRVVHFSGSSNCPAHGEFSFNATKIGELTVGNRCPECMREAQSRAEQINLQKQKQREVEALWDRKRAAGVPAAFRDFSFETCESPDSPEMREVMEYLYVYSKHFHLALETKPATGLVMCGLTGTGKTTLACAVLDMLLKNGYSVRYACAPTMLIELKDAEFGRHQLSLSTLVSQLSSPHLLVLDEFGTHTTTDANYQLLFSVIEGRYQNNLPTILLTNLPQGQLSRVLDERFMERILGNTNGSTLSLRWPSLRMANKGRD